MNILTGVNARKDDPIAALIDGVFVTRPLVDDTRSDTSFKLAKYWLETCLEKHKSKCKIKDSPLPTRVLDVGQLGDHSVSLHISNGEVGKWFTLSHCWGKHQPAKTTMGNLMDRCSGISLSSLPQTFRDAVLITRKLCYRYLWIDSLCIIQDSVSDWLVESVKMNEVYSHGVLNISADAATDSREGIFDSAKKRILDGPGPFAGWVMKPDQLEIPVHSPKTGITSFLYAYVYVGDVQPDTASHLQTRAWVFQEAALSPRRLRYTYHGMFWTCTSAHMDCNEKQPQEIHNFHWQESYVFSIYDIPHQPLPPRYVRGQEPARGFLAVDWWYKEVNNYANRDLTYFNDRFPAFSGIAKEFGERTGYHYKAGIWLEDFRRGLLWQSRDRIIHPEVGPSWSWATVSGGADPNGVYDTNLLSEYLDNEEEAELLDVTIENMDNNPYGQVISASITLRGLCHKLNSLWEAHTFHYQNGQHILYDKDYLPFQIDKQPPPTSIAVSVDIMDHSKKLFWQQENIILMKIAKFGKMQHSSSWVFQPDKSERCLILEQLLGTQNTYRRIGVLGIPGDGIGCEGWEMKTATII